MSQKRTKKYDYGEKYYQENGLDGFEARGRMDHDAILAQVDFGENDNVLEIGCGLGVLLSRVGSKNKFGVESNTFSVDKCREKGLDVRLHDNPYDLPYEDNFFDKVIMNEVIEHIEDVDLVVKEVSRVLKNKGIFIVTTPNKGILVRNLSESHCSEMTYGELRAIIKKNNFRIMKHLVSGINIWDFLGGKIVYPTAKKIREIGFFKKAIDNTRKKIDRSKIQIFRKKFRHLGTQQLLVAENRKDHLS